MLPQSLPPRLCGVLPGDVTRGYYGGFSGPAGVVKSWFR